MVSYYSSVRPLATLVARLSGPTLDTRSAHRPHVSSIAMEPPSVRRAFIYGTSGVSIVYAGR